MVKRHPSLQPLSREHFTGLTLAQRMMKGYPEMVKSNWPPNDNITGQAARAQEIFDKELLIHFQNEEIYVFSEAKSYLTSPESKELLNQILEDHTYIKKAFQELNVGSEIEIKQKLFDIGTRLETHIRIEERDLFPILEKELPNEILDAIGKNLLKRKSHDCSLLL